MTKLYLVDDHPAVREALRSLFERTADLSVCGEAATGAAALADLADAAPDLVLVDVSLPDMSGIELATRLRKRHPHLLLAMLSAHGEPTRVREALQAGAGGYILKGNAWGLVPAIRQILRGEVYVSDPLKPEDEAA